jgi:hypothetical protein
MDETEREDICTECGEEAFLYVGGAWWCVHHQHIGFYHALDGVPDG